jgi:hypothetical protein
MKDSTRPVNKIRGAYLVNFFFGFCVKLQWLLLARTVFGLRPVRSIGTVIKPGLIFGRHFPLVRDQQIRADEDKW